MRQVSSLVCSEAMRKRLCNVSKDTEAVYDPMRRTLGVSILTKCSMPKGWFRAYLKSTLVENHSFERHQSPSLTTSPARNRNRKGRWGLWCGPGKGHRGHGSGEWEHAQERTHKSHGGEPEMTKEMSALTYMGLETPLTTTSSPSGHHPCMLWRTRTQKCRDVTSRCLVTTSRRCLLHTVCEGVPGNLSCQQTQRWNQGHLLSRLSLWPLPHFLPECGHCHFV